MPRRRRCRVRWQVWVLVALILFFAVRSYVRSGDEPDADTATRPPTPSADASAAKVDELDLVGAEETRTSPAAVAIDAQVLLLQDEPSLADCRFFSESPPVHSAVYTEGELNLLAEAEPYRPSSSLRPSPLYSLRSDDAHPPLVSVITALPAAATLTQVTELALHTQTLQQWEWLIAVPEGSPPPALSAFASDRRVRIIRGVQAAPRAFLLNAALRAAEAPLAFVLDPLDELEPTALDKLYWYLVTHNESAVATAWFRDTLRGGVSRLTLQLQGRRRIAVSQPAGAMLMMRRDVVLSVGGYNTAPNVNPDWNLLCRLLEKGHWGVTVPEVLLWDADTVLAKHDGSSLCSVPASRDMLEESQHFRFADIAHPLPPTNLLTPSHASILLILPFLDLGGADAWNLNVVKLLVRRGWRITIVSMIPWDHPWKSRFLHLTTDLWDAPQWIPHNWQAAWLTYLIESRAVDVVMISNTFAGYHLLPYLRRFAPRPAYVDFCHSATGKWYHGGYPHVSALYSKFLDRSVFAANNVRKSMLSHGGDERRTGVVYAGVNATFYARNEASRARVRRVLGLADTDVLIVYIGRLTLEKGPDTLATILERLDAQPPSAAYSVLIVGSGDQEAKVRTRVSALRSARRVRMVGSRAPAQVARYLSAADVLLLPSRFEGVALVVYEAMAAGVVPVASDVGGQAELVTPDAGLLIPVYTDEAQRVSAFFDALTSLITDGARLARMKEAARSRIASAFSLEWMETKLRKEFCLAERDRRTGPFLYDDTWATMAMHLNHLEQQEQVEWKRAESKEKKAYMDTVYRLPPS